MPKYKVKYQEIIAVLGGNGEWTWELPDGTKKTEYAENSSDISFLDFYEKIQPERSKKEEGGLMDDLIRITPEEANRLRTELWHQHFLYATQTHGMWKHLCEKLDGIIDDLTKSDDRPKPKKPLKRPQWL